MWLCKKMMMMVVRMVVCVGEQGCGGVHMILPEPPEQRHRGVCARPGGGRCAFCRIIAAALTSTQ